MNNIKQRGLSGKARRVHYRNRAVRLYSQQVIEDFLEPDTNEGARGRRHIPIRGRKEFLPSIAHTSHVADARDANAGTQLELPNAVSDGRGIVIRLADAGRAPPQRKAEEALRFPRSGKSAAPIFESPEQAKVDKNFTIGGFLLGCAMGSAAAALLLLVVQTAIG